MTLPLVQITFLCDEDVPAPVLDFLKSRGHRVTSVTHSTFEGEPDDVITKLGHFLTRVSRRPPDNHLRYPAVGRLSIKCPRPSALERLSETIEDVEREYQVCSTRSDKRLIMTLDDNYFTRCATFPGCHNEETSLRCAVLSRHKRKEVWRWILTRSSSRCTA